ncbi:ASCH domain-containing protein [Rhodobacteraceae bacterium EhC02]|nr:ASCH domain-containing protein [Rhodobacteraceae bacterium EhC02]
MTEVEAIARYPGAGSFRFGDSRALNAQILDLVRQGRKTVTCDAVAGFARRSEPLPEPGRTDIALDWDGAPVLAIRTVDVTRMPFSAMTEDLVADQGEFRDLADWRAGYRAYLTRAGLFSPDAEMLVERFTVVEVFA